jgi:ribosomal protein S18 acetylase RimI-like enzyme
MKYEIREIDPSNEKDVATVTRLHLELLPQGPMAGLGELFLRRFCYTRLIRDGLMKAALFQIGGNPAGFAAYTDRSITFHRKAIRKRWGYVAYLVLLSVAREPRILARLPRAVRLMLCRRCDLALGEDPLAEIVAIGVRRNYTRPSFVRRTGIKISEELIKHALSHFRQVGLDKVRMLVDEDNKAALLFYHSMGARIEPYEQANEPTVQVWLDLGHQLF